MDESTCKKENIVFFPLSSRFWYSCVDSFVVSQGLFHNHPDCSHLAGEDESARKEAEILEILNQYQKTTVFIFYSPVEAQVGINRGCQAIVVQLRTCDVGAR